MKKEFKSIPVNQLIPYDKNPRINGPAVEAVCESIRQCENIDPIEVDENMVILSGHTRRLAMIELGIDTADVIVVSGLSEEQKRKYRILANKTNEFAEWDFDLLKDELEDLDFGDFDFKLVSTDVAEDDYPEEEKSGSEDVGNFEESEFKYKNMYGITVVVENEAEQEKVYNWLTELGYTCKVVTV